MSTLALSGIKWFACFVLASTSFHAFGSEMHCPANVASLQYRLVNRYQMLVDVMVNQSGPYSFLFDTGTQLTMLEPSLASELHLKEEGSAAVASVGVNAHATFAHVDRVAAGSHSLPNLKVLVYDLNNLQVAGISIRGVLGEDFLEHFDTLIDNAHHLLCLDDSGAMRAEVKGARIPLLAPAQAGNGAQLPASLVVSARLSDGMRPVRLKLDSGTNVPFLYNTSDYMALGLFHGVSLRGGGANGQRTFTALPPQTIRIGKVEVQNVGFVTLAGVQKDSRTAEFDGLLAVGLFKSVFVDQAGHFAVLEAW